MIRLLALLATCAVCCLPVGAGDAPGDQHGPPPMVLSYLTGAGVEIETASLIAAAERHDDPTVRWAAVSVLAELLVPEADDLFRRLLTSSERQLQIAAAFGLGRLGEEEGLAALEDLLLSAIDGMERMHVAGRLARLGRSSGYVYVVAALGHGSNIGGAALDPDDSPANATAEAVRASAVSTLAFFLEPGVVGAAAEPAPSTLLLSAAADPSPWVRSEVLTQISVVVHAERLTVAEVRPVVETRGRSDPDPDVRQQARSLLSAWRAEAPNQPTCSSSSGLRRTGAPRSQQAPPQR